MVREHVAAMKTAAADDTRVIFSCGGGLPPGVSTANLRAFLDEALSGS
jgi:uroporphyrinogen-III decarboxylase